jgi:large subunit ribosomal protein L20
MPRAGSGITKHKRSKKILDLAKGYRGRRHTLYRVAQQAVMKAGNYAYRDRKAKKRDFRKLWIARINAQSRLFGMSYSTFIRGLQNAGVLINRKFLSEIAVNDEPGFKKLVEVVQAHK